MGNLPEEHYENLFEHHYKSWPQKVRNSYSDIQNEILYTIDDQPRIDGEYFWCLGERVELWSVFETYKVPEKYWDIFAKLLGFDSIDDEVGIEEEWIRELKKYEKRLAKKYGPKIDEFQSHLEKFPMLGLSHYIGRRVLKDITQFSVMSIYSNCFYRARRVTDGKIYSKQDMLKPPSGLSEEGRYNHPGMSVLYLADSEQAAALEVAENSQEPFICWMQKIQVQNFNNILDFATVEQDPDINFKKQNELLYAALLNGVFFNEVKDQKRKGKPEYLITRFVTDCARNAGIKGVYYRSTKSRGNNLVIFDTSSDSEKIILEDEPYYFEHKPTSSRYINETDGSF